MLIKVFEHHLRSKRNVKTAVDFWTRQRKADKDNWDRTFGAWEDIISALDAIRQAMSDLPDVIDRPSAYKDYMIRMNCNRICQNIVRIVNNYTAMKEEFTTYMTNNQYDTVKMKFFKAHATQPWGGFYVKCGRLFGGAENLPLLSFLHRVHDVFLIPQDPEVYEDRWPHRCTWPDTAAVPTTFIYKELNTETSTQRPKTMKGVIVTMPDGSRQVGHVIAGEGPIVTIKIDAPLPQTRIEDDSSADEADREYSRDEQFVRDSMRTVRIGPDRDDDEGVVAGSHIPRLHHSVHTTPESDDDGGEDVDLNAGFWSDRSDAHLTTMLHDLKQLSFS